LGIDKGYAESSEPEESLTRRRLMPIDIVEAVEHVLKRKHQ
jgi:hypothetical protein